MLAFIETNGELQRVLRFTIELSGITGKSQQNENLMIQPTHASGVDSLSQALCYVHMKHEKNIADCWTHPQVV